MHVGMEEAVAKRVTQEGLDQHFCELFQIVAGSPQRRDVVHLGAVDPLHGDDVAAGPFPVHFRHAETWVVRRVFGNLGKGCSLQAQVHFHLGRLFQRPRHLNRAKPAAGGHQAFLHAGNHIHAFDVICETLAHAGAHHFHGHLFAVHFGRVHLRDRGGRNRLFERCVEITDRAAKRGLDGGFGSIRGEEGHPVLQHGKIDGPVDADDIRAGGEKLADLHIGRTKPSHGAGQPFAAGLLLRPETGERLEHGLENADGRRQVLCRQGRNHAFADKNPADTGEPEISADRAHRFRASSRNAAPRSRRYNWCSSRAKNRRCGSSLRNFPGWGICGSIPPDTGRARNHR